jgi:hypothetical protein
MVSRAGPAGAYQAQGQNHFGAFYGLSFINPLINGEIFGRRPPRGNLSQFGVECVAVSGGRSGADWV